MRIERIDAVYDGDNISKKIKLFVDEEWRALSVYLYFVPVIGEDVYTTAEPITLDDNGEAEYLIPGDVLNGEGVFGAQIVCIDENGAEIAKSAVYTDECGQSIDDQSAVLPTGEVITLAQLFAKFDSLTASEVGYVDTEGVGATNVQEAIDYALTHGGGASDPVYVLRWSENPEDFRNYNVIEIAKFIDKSVGSYELYLQTGNTTTQIEVYEIRGGVPLTMYFRGSWNGEQEKIYRIICGETPASYEQTSYILPDLTFDASSLAAPSMFATAEYIDRRIGTAGDLDPDSYASADDVEAIEAKIPSAASAQNQLADKGYVTTKVSGKQDTLSEAEQSAVDSGITSAKVSAYDAHVANSTIHVTGEDKAAWDEKYDLPPAGIPAAHLATAVRNALTKANAAVQPTTSKDASHIFRLTADTATLTDGCTTTCDSDYWSVIDALNYMTDVTILAKGAASDSLSLQMHVAAAEHPDEVLPLFSIYNDRLFYVELTENANGQLSGVLSVTEIADKAYVTSAINSAIGDVIGGSY